MCKIKFYYLLWHGLSDVLTKHRLAIAAARRSRRESLAGSSLSLTNKHAQVRIGSGFAGPGSPRAPSKAGSATSAIEWPPARAVPPHRRARAH